MYRNFNKFEKAEIRNLSYGKGPNSYLKLTFERLDGNSHNPDKGRHGHTEC